MQMTSELLQMAQIRTPAQTRRADGGDGGQKVSEGKTEFERLLRSRAEAGGTKTGEPRGLQDDAAKRPQEPKDEATRETAELAMLMTQIPLRIQAAEPMPEPLTAVPAVSPQIGGEAGPSSGLAQAALSSAGIPQPGQPGVPQDLPTPQMKDSAGQETAPFRTAEAPEPVWDAENRQGTLETQPRQTNQTPPEPAVSAQSGGGSAKAGHENGDLANGSENGETLRPENADAGAAEPLFRTMDAVPVKVGEAPAADTTRPDLDEQLANRMDAALKDGARQITLRLTPDSLGSLTVDLTQSADGALRVVFHTTTEKAAELLSRHADSLSALLQSGGQSAVRVEVQPQEEARQYQQQNQQNQQNQQQEQSRRQHEHRRQSGEDFLHQLRLGLVTPDGRVS